MARTRTEQPAFSALELGPELHQRRDTSKYQSGLRRARNVLGKIGGGVYSRPGLLFCAPIQNEALSGIVVPFQYSIDQAYCLLLGNLTMRVCYRGAMLTEPELLITAITNANPGAVTVEDHGYQTGEDVYFSGITGMTELNGRTIRVTRTGTDTFTLDGVDTTNYGVFTGSGGGVAGNVDGGEGGYPPGGIDDVIAATPPPVFEDAATEPPVSPPSPHDIAYNDFVVANLRQPITPEEFNFWMLYGRVPNINDPYYYGPSLPNF